MKVEKFRHRNNDLQFPAIQVQPGNQNDIAKWCGGTAKGRQSKRIVILSKKDGEREAKIGDFIIKIGKSFVKVDGIAFFYIFITEEQYRKNRANRERDAVRM